MAQAGLKVLGRLDAKPRHSKANNANDALYSARSAEDARLKSLNPGDPAAVTAGLAAWTTAHPQPVATIADVVAHIQHIRDVAGVDHVGLGGDYDGVDSLPVGLEGVDAYPRLLAALMANGWTEADVR